MKKIYGIFLVLLAGCLLTSCSENIFDGLNTSGKKVTLDLKYEELLPTEIKITRTNGNDKENALKNLQVFVFDEDGKLKGYKWITHNASATDETFLKQDGKPGQVTINTLSGNSQIYGVANVPTSLYTIEPSKAIPTSETEAAEDDWKEVNVQNGKSNFTLSDLKSVLYSRLEEQFEIVSDGIMMSGLIGTDGSCTINSNGSVTVTNASDSDEPLIKLRRIVAKIQCKVKQGNGVEFTPTNCEIHNIPRKGKLIEDDENETEGSNYEDVYKVDLKTVTDNGTVSYIFDDVYLPENKQSIINADNFNKELTSTSLLIKVREKDNGNTAVDNKTFTYAPPNGTYMVLNGTYRGPKSSTDKTEYVGTVRYYIHLGNFDKNSADFDVDRNCYYKYSITINGVNDIIAEVEVEPDQSNGSAEGMVFNIQNGTVFDLDSHYCQLDMEFSKGDVTETDNSGEYFMYFMAKDPYNESGVCKISTTDNGNTFKITKGFASTTTINESDLSWLNWVEFKEGRNVSYPGQGKGLSHLLDVLKKLINKKIQGWTDNEKVRYTCFLNENYYVGKQWNTFVNKNQRYVYICRDIEVSRDQRNVTGATIYGLRQYSIQTFYNLDEAATISAYGCETNADDNYKNNSCNLTDIKKMDIPYPITASWHAIGTDTWNGRKNMLSDLDENGWNVRTWKGTDKNCISGNNNYQRARYVCMSRNRDLNGNGTIDDDEVRWYCPTLQQYAGLLIGEQGYAQNARPYTGNTDDLKTETGKEWQYRQNGTHYYFNDWDGIENKEKTTRYIWAEEGLATSFEAGNGASTEATKLLVRCVRNLEKGTNSGAGVGEIIPDGYYVIDTDNRTISLSHMNSGSVRSMFMDTELSVHNQNGSENKPARKFEYAETVVKNDDETNMLTSMKNVVESTVSEGTICKNYHKVAGDKWRAPNQQELNLMHVLGVTSHQRECCRTKYSSPSFRYSWEDRADGVIYQVEMRQADDKNPNLNANNDLFTVRCVRDVK